MVLIGSIVRDLHYEDYFSKLTISTSQKSVFINLLADTFQLVSHLQCQFRRNLQTIATFLISNISSTSSLLTFLSCKSGRLNANGNKLRSKWHWRLLTARKASVNDIIKKVWWWVKMVSSKKKSFPHLIVLCRKMFTIWFMVKDSSYIFFNVTTTGCVLSTELAFLLEIVNDIEGWEQAVFILCASTIDMDYIP